MCCVLCVELLVRVAEHLSNVEESEHGIGPNINMDLMIVAVP